MQTSPLQSNFTDTVWRFYANHKRALPWREDHSFYPVLVSEMMLQQTQVERVIPKFESFLRSFPTIDELGKASLHQVLVAWQGLGYNRRAKFLHMTAQAILLKGIPTTQSELQALPGIGDNTAGAILAYAYNQPSVYIETNIRTVYLHHFFKQQTAVSDNDILQLVEATLDRENPREWYWALMDYGTHLKKTTTTHISQSRHYKKQPTFAGSMREMRGRIIAALAAASCSQSALSKAVGSDERFIPALEALKNEAMIEKRQGKWCLTVTSEHS